MKRQFITAALVALGAVTTSFAAFAAPSDSVPASGRLTFDVIRKGKDIGDYTVTFRGKGGDLDVDLRTDVKVKVPVIGVSAYTFRQQSTETWRGGKLAALSSKTDDNGTPHSISVGATPLIPASLWSADLLAARQVLNTINGGTDTISVRKLGTESVATGSGSVKAAHYAVSGGLNRELWYADGKLVHVRFKADDGSVIDYALR
ncbi:DUF6134 family protein [Paracoccus mangrovi]|jgi:hypothetical protein|uniref:DUF6134 family protein n=1 Tax=Paracoccus mangrovi TaxID=1715645 RepID=A0ABV7R696_9RHOB